MTVMVPGAAGAQGTDLNDPSVKEKLETLERILLHKVYKTESIENRTNRLWKYYFKQNSNDGISTSVQLEQVFRTANLKNIVTSPSLQSSESQLLGSDAVREQHDDGSITLYRKRNINKDLKDAFQNLSKHRRSDTPQSLSKTRNDIPLAKPKNIVFLLDCSKSMDEPLDLGRERKFDLAKTVIAKVVKVVPKDVDCALRVFGQSATPGLECRASALLVPLSANSRKTITQALHELEPTGMSPLTYALWQLNEKDLNGIAENTLTILLGDGADTCGEDPVSFVRERKRRGVSLSRMIVLAFTSARQPTDANQLQEIAKATDGKFYRTSDLDKILNELRFGQDR